jgi:hypothetical protein
MKLLVQTPTFPYYTSQFVAKLVLIRLIGCLKLVEVVQGVAMKVGSIAPR